MERWGTITKGSVSNAGEERKSAIERDGGDRKERLRLKHPLSILLSVGRQSAGEAQVLALRLSHSFRRSIPPPPAAVYFKPLFDAGASNKPKIPANTSYPETLISLSPPPPHPLHERKNLRRKNCVLTLPLHF